MNQSMIHEYNRKQELFFLGGGEEGQNCKKETQSLFVEVWIVMFKYRRNTAKFLFIHILTGSWARGGRGERQKGQGEEEGQRQGQGQEGQRQGQGQGQERWQEGRKEGREERGEEVIIMVVNIYSLSPPPPPTCQHHLSTLIAHGVCVCVIMLYMFFSTKHIFHSRGHEIKCWISETNSAHCFSAWYTANFPNFRPSYNCR